MERGYSYIFAARIKSMKKEITDMIFDENGYREIKAEEGEILRYKFIEYINEFTAKGKKTNCPKNFSLPALADGREKAGPTRKG
ncbi:MAG: hypothetical protein QHH10_09355 [Peptococcaceae bacterium]|nr:hypothetical protein [Peptococcaceae bacterium]MDH7525504.1 hypothetical protein [Peptococcaceae bacterium]